MVDLITMFKEKFEVYMIDESKKFSFFFVYISQSEAHIHLSAIRLKCNGTYLYLRRSFILTVLLLIRNQLLNCSINNIKQISLLDKPYIGFWLSKSFLFYLCFHLILFVMSMSLLMTLIISRWKFEAFDRWFLMKIIILIVNYCIINSRCLSF